MTTEKHDLEIWPGPMEGVAGEVFTAAVNHLGLVDRWMTPFLRLGDGIPRRKLLAGFLAPFLAGGVPVTAQVMGNCGRTLGKCAAELLKLGAADINLNCGCPSRRVVSHGGGGGALRDPEKLAKMLEVMHEESGGMKFSVKMRCGYTSADECGDIIGLLNSTGAVGKYFIHFRTVSEGYAPVEGRVSRLKRAVAAAGGIPVVVNGDVVAAAEGRQLAELTGAAGVMVARGWMRDPWLLKRMAGAAGVPEAAWGRKLFFAELRRCGLSGGQAVEAARLLWQSDSEEFRMVLDGKL